MNRISGKEVLAQLKYDLIGKDSYRGVSLTYSWMANQFGHFSLGFIPCLLAYSFLKKHADMPHLSLWAALLVSITWLLFETYNFLGPLLKTRTSGFGIAWGNVAFDTVTDVCFFALGAFAAGWFLEGYYLPAMVMIVVVALLSYPVYYWYLTKMYLQAAQYPFQFRLSQWNLDISDVDKDTILQFMEPGATGKHLLVFGSKNSGKTSISVGIATEMSIRRHSCLYTTAMKQCCLFYDLENAVGSAQTLWGWRDCSLLVIDDCNPGDPVPDDLIHPHTFLQWLDAAGPVEECINRQLIRDKNVIWVMGSARTGKDSLSHWQQMLAEIGVAPENRLAVNLSQGKI